MLDVMLIVHFFGLAMGVGTGFAQLFLSKAAKKMEAGAGEQFLLKTLYINNMGKIGVTLLILSGGYLMTPYWQSVTAMPALLSKLILVVLLVAQIAVSAVLAKKAKQNNGGEYLSKLGLPAKVILFTGLLIIIAAVLSFH